MVVYVALYPLLQVYVAVLPITSPELNTTLPLAGLLKLGHDSAKKKDAQVSVFFNGNFRKKTEHRIYEPFQWSTINGGMFNYACPRGPKPRTVLFSYWMSKLVSLSFILFTFTSLFVCLKSVSLPTDAVERLIRVDACVFTATI